MPEQRLISALRDIISGSDANDGDALANAIQAARALVDGTASVAKLADEDEEDHPQVGERAACHLCGQDIEWTGDDWRDRGGNRGCVPYTERGKIVQPPEGALHAPAEHD